MAGSIISHAHAQICRLVRSKEADKARVNHLNSAWRGRMHLKTIIISKLSIYFTQLLSLPWLRGGADSDEEHSRCFHTRPWRCSLPFVIINIKDMCLDINMYACKQAANKQSQSGMRFSTLQLWLAEHIGRFSFGFLAMWISIGTVKQVRQPNIPAVLFSEEVMAHYW